MTGPDASAFDAAPQHGPRPLPLFLDMLRSETAASPQRRRAALAGLAAFQRAERPIRADPMPRTITTGRAVLRGYGGTGRIVVVVPSLINPPAILDLSAEQSLLRWLATQGVRPLMVDWATPTPGDRSVDIDAHVAALRSLVAQLPEPPVLVGYCLGGTIALAAACGVPVAGLALIAAPWRFAGYGEARAAIASLWATARNGCDRLGLVPMEVLQAGFWQLDPARTIAKYEAFAATEPGSAAAAAFVRLEDWANAGAPLTFGVGRQLFEEFVAADLPGRGRWVVGGAAVGPAALACPAVEFVSLPDRIVPAAAAAGLADSRPLGAGHVGMVVGSRARAQLWEPLRNWITGLG